MKSQEHGSLFVIRTFVSIALAGFLLAGCAQAPVPTAAPAAPVTEVAETAVPGAGTSRSIGNVMVPLPEGDWTKVGAVDLSSSPRYLTTAHVLVSKTGNAIDRVVIVWEQEARGSGFFNDFKKCDAASNLAQSIVSKQATSTDCVYSRALAWGDNGKISSMVRRYARANGMFAPLVTVGPRVAFSLRRRHRMAVDYAFNVDLLAPRADRALWTPADWTPATVQAGTQAATVKELHAFGERMRPLVRQANRGSS